MPLGPEGISRKIFDENNVDKIDQALDRIYAKVEKIKSSGFDRSFERALEAQLKLGSSVSKTQKHSKNYQKHIDKINETYAKMEKRHEHIAMLLRNGNLTQAQMNKLTQEQLDLDTKLNTQQRDADQKALKRAAKKRAYMEDAADVGGKLGAFGIGLITGAISFMVGAATSGYRVLDKLTAAAGSMSRALGPMTPDLKALQSTARELYFGDLGSLGYSLEELSGDVISFAEGVGFSGEAMQGNVGHAIRMSKQLAITSGELGEARRAFDMMNVPIAKQDLLFGNLDDTARALGLPVSSLTKNLLVGGKNMFSWFGPSRAKQTIASLAGIQKSFGILSQTVEGFTKKTDNFDETVQGMAKLNTAFGTHLNALEVFAEEDPAKRFEMISDALKQQGKSTENLTRRERSLIAETLGLNNEEVNGLLRKRKGNESLAKTMERVNEEQEKAAKNEERNRENIGKLTTTLMNFGLFFEKISLSGLKLMKPFLEGLGIGGSFENLSGVMNGLAASIDKIFTSIGKDPTFVKNMKALGESVKGIFSSFGEFLKDPEMMQKTTDFFSMLSGAATGAAKVLNFFSGSSKSDNQKEFDKAHKEGKQKEYYAKHWDELDWLEKIGVRMNGWTPPGKASGGGVQARSPYMVGERGPEIFVPNSGGSIIPAGPTSAMTGGGGTTIVQVFLDGEMIQERTYTNMMRRN